VQQTDQIADLQREARRAWQLLSRSALLERVDDPEALRRGLDKFWERYGDELWRAVLLELDDPDPRNWLSSRMCLSRCVAVDHRFRVHARRAVENRSFTPRQRWAALEVLLRARDPWLAEKGELAHSWVRELEAQRVKELVELCLDEALGGPERWEFLLSDPEDALLVVKYFRQVANPAGVRLLQWLRQRSPSAIVRRQAGRVLREVTRRTHPRGPVPGSLVLGAASASRSRGWTEVMVGWERPSGNLALMRGLVVYGRGGPELVDLDFVPYVSPVESTEMVKSERASLGRGRPQFPYREVEANLALGLIQGAWKNADQRLREEVASTPWGELYGWLLEADGLPEMPEGLLRQLCELDGDPVTAASAHAEAVLRGDVQMARLLGLPPAGVEGLPVMDVSTQEPLKSIVPRPHLVGAADAWITQVTPEAAVVTVVVAVADSRDAGGVSMLICRLGQREDGWKVIDCQWASGDWRQEWLNRVRQRLGAVEVVVNPRRLVQQAYTARLQGRAQEALDCSLLAWLSCDRDDAARPLAAWALARSAVSDHRPGLAILAWLSLRHQQGDQLPAARPYVAAMETVRSWWDPEWSGKVPDPETVQGVISRFPKAFGIRDYLEVELLSLLWGDLLSTGALPHPEEAWSWAAVLLTVWHAIRGVLAEDVIPGQLAEAVASVRQHLARALDMWDRRLGLRLEFSPLEKECVRLMVTEAWRWPEEDRPVRAAAVDTLMEVVSQYPDWSGKVTDGRPLLLWAAAVVTDPELDTDKAWEALRYIIGRLQLGEGEGSQVLTQVRQSWEGEFERCRLAARRLRTEIADTRAVDVIPTLRVRALGEEGRLEAEEVDGSRLSLRLAEDVPLQPGDVLLDAAVHLPSGRLLGARRVYPGPVVDDERGESPEGA